MNDVPEQQIMRETRLALLTMGRQPDDSKIKRLFNEALTRVMLRDGVDRRCDGAAAPVVKYYSRRDADALVADIVAH